jgi:hypothetical protein
MVSLLQTPYVFSQEQQGRKRVYDIGLTFYNLNQFGINFKTGSEKSLLRIKVLALNFGSGNSDSPNYIQYYYIDSDGQFHYSWSVDLQKIVSKGGELEIGFEKRIDLMKNFQLSLGADAGISYTSYHSSLLANNYLSWELDPSLFLVAGVNYQIGEHFIITAEISPHLSYHYGLVKIDDNGITREYPISGFYLGLTNQAASITVAYRLTKVVYYKF